VSGRLARLGAEAVDESLQIRAPLLQLFDGVAGQNLRFAPLLLEL
jgi:hypothetical protein